MLAVSGEHLASRVTWYINPFSVVTYSWKITGDISAASLDIKNCEREGCSRGKICVSAFEPRLGGRCELGNCQIKGQAMDQRSPEPRGLTVLQNQSGN